MTARMQAIDAATPHAQACGSRGVAGAPYNMAPAQVGERHHFELLGVCLDKLRIAFTMPAAARLLEDVPGIGGVRSRPSRRWGMRAVNITQGWIGDRGVEGVVYFECRAVDGAGTTLVEVEFNPRKWAADVAETVTRWVRSKLGVNRMASVWVRRYDVAIDYLGLRSRIVLDDPLRVSDRFGCGPTGCESERTGYRKGSRLKFQLYDKRAERLAKGGDDPGDVVRFECQVQPEADTLRLGELGDVECPFGRVTVRCSPHDPASVDDVVMGLLNELALVGSMRMAKARARNSLSPKRLEQWMGCVLPEVMPSPREAFNAHWRQAVERDLSLMMAKVLTSTGQGAHNATSR